MAKLKQAYLKRDNKFTCKDCENSYDYQNEGKNGFIFCRCKLDPVYLKLLNHEYCRYIKLKSNNSQKNKMKNSYTLFRAERVFNEVQDWSLKTFPEATEKGQLGKLINEATEAFDNPGDISEYADCLICLIGAAARAGFELSNLVEAVENKLDINKLRKWKKSADGAYQHELREVDDQLKDVVIPKSNTVIE